jgi:CRISPR-associated endonuclease/helicase Cas3
LSGLLSFWAKLGKETWPDKYHPVLCHLIDVASVTMNLWETILRPRFRTWFAQRLCLEDDSCARWLAFWCGAHDIGKVTPCFQHRGTNTGALHERLVKNGFDFCSGNTAHGALGTRILAVELADATGWPAIDRNLARAVAIAVGGHHGLFPTNWDDICSHLGNQHWTLTRRLMLAELARLLGVTNLRQPRPRQTEDQSVWMCLAGLTSVADWIGSNQEFFPSIGNVALVGGSLSMDDYFTNSKAQAREALHKLGWLREVVTSRPLTFAELFPAIKAPRPLQTAAAELVGSMTEPGLMIIEAPMGEGKTEAGWYAAAYWERCGGQGTYVALPTMATSNQMFDRVADFLGANSGKQNLMLQHGKAALNKQFEKLKYAALVYDDEKHPSAVVAEGWFASNKKHGLLAPYGVGTIDQALLGVLQTKHVFVRLFGLAGKSVILDEVHAYDTYMTTLMKSLLRWLAALGCPVVLLSATLPREKRLELLRAYGGENLREPNWAKYPRITTVTPGGFAHATAVEADHSRERTIQLGWLAEEDLADQLRKSLAGGGCAAVIRNTVGLAQETYLRLRDALKKDGITVDLFHARFPFGRRMEIENGVLHRFGRSCGAAERDRRVLVATQVVEQSLDLDFDLMISDVAPVDLVLQRAGRLHRHARGPRPEAVHEPRLWLIKPASDEAVPDFGRSEYVYARFVLLRSFLALKSAETIRLPNELERFVEQVYGNEALIIPDNWHTDLEESAQWLKVKRERQQLGAMDVSISDPDQWPLEQRSQQLEDDDPEAAVAIQAQTRDSPPTIQLVVIYHLDGRDYLDPEGTELFDEANGPDFERVRRLLENEVSTAHPGCFRFFVGQRSPAAWRETAMLRHHRILRVNEKGNLIGGEVPVQIDPELGMII